jgi:hypothetical protein
MCTSWTTVPATVEAVPRPEGRPAENWPRLYSGNWVMRSRWDEAQIVRGGHPSHLLIVPRSPATDFRPEPG